MRDCVTHHRACDCREAEFAALRAALGDIASRRCLGDSGPPGCSGRSCITCVAKVALGDVEPSAYQETAGHLQIQVRALRERVATLEDGIDDLRRYRDEWIAERERRTELERGIRQLSDFIRDQDRVMAGVLDALLDVSPVQDDDTEAR